MAGGGTTIAALARKNGLRVVTPEELTIRRQRRGRGFVYLRPSGRPVKDEATLRRFRSLAVPPAYTDVLLAEDPAAHLQAIGRDAAGRLQYRYHPNWEIVREARKSRRLKRLATVLPQLRRRLLQHLRCREATRDHALAAVIELVWAGAIRAGTESYVQSSGARGAVTLLKSQVRVAGRTIVLNFRGKGGRMVEKSIVAPPLARALRRIARLPGGRLFQYRDENGEVRPVRSAEVNVFLRAMAQTRISMKDFRTMAGTMQAMEHLAQVEPAGSHTARQRQVMAAMRDVADHLANTPAVCRRSYVHQAVLTAFESGALQRLAAERTRRMNGTHLIGLLARP
jgi:DNA topoisomerase-1